MGDYLIKKMGLEDLRVALDWAAAEGWNPGLGDCEPFHAADPDGFFMAVAPDGQVGCVSAVAYGHDFGFIGFFIVRPDRRGHRVGPDLVHQALARLGGRDIGLDGVEKKISNYENLGFKLAHNNVRYAGTTAAAPLSGETFPLEEGHFEELLAFDRRFFPAPRPGFLALWIGPRGGAALGAMEHGKLKGYGVIRPCRQGYKVGPLFAESPELAFALFSDLGASVASGAPLFLDVPAVNPSAVRLAELNRMRPVFKTARMYNKEFPPLPLDSIYGITSFELG